MGVPSTLENPLDPFDGAGQGMDDVEVVDDNNLTRKLGGVALAAPTISISNNKPTPLTSRSQGAIPPTGESMALTAKWNGYTFEVYHPSASWAKVGAVYIFCAINQANQWVPLYVGQASSLAERFANHERWQEAVRLGATHIHLIVLSRQSHRDLVEEELIQSYQPRMNVQLKAAR